MVFCAAEMHQDCGQRTQPVGVLIIVINFPVSYSFESRNEREQTLNYELFQKKAKFDDLSHLTRVTNQIRSKNRSNKLPFNPTALSVSDHIAINGTTFCFSTVTVSLAPACSNCSLAHAGGRSFSH
jgi:hypothetical protein